MSTKFFADTYALIEIIKGNKAYKNFLALDLFTSELNVMELYYHCISSHDKETAEKYLHLFLPFAVPLTVFAIRMGMEFKLLHKKEKLSYVDCTGYALAEELGIPFLTGDQKFENKENVEFVK